MKMIMLAVAVLVAAPTYDKPKMVTRVFPAMQISDIGRGGADVLLTAELKGPEVEEWYCPKVTWEFPDSTKATHEQDCAPFEQRNECYPALAADCGFTGFKLNKQTGEYENKFKECACNITGYPNIWRMRKGAPAHPYGEHWSVWVSLSKNGKLLARQEIRFWVK